jgi:hypothetical protein
MMHYALLGIRIVCAMTGFQVIVFDIKTFDHTNDNLFKSNKRHQTQYS